MNKKESPENMSKTPLFGFNKNCRIFPNRIMAYHVGLCAICHSSPLYFFLNLAR